MLTTMSWAVTAWPPVGGLGGRITHRPPTHSLNLHEHTHTQTHFHTVRGVPGELEDENW